jgi:hypothetical protein
LTSSTSQSPTPTLMVKLSAPMGWYSTPSKSDCTMQLTPKEASGSRNYPTHSGGFVLNLPGQQGSHPTSLSIAPKLFYLPT